jgi:peptidoglycan/xylan/chitin deacetylase (PgdA/CDA1 family)
VRALCYSGGMRITKQIGISLGSTAAVLGMTLGWLIQSHHFQWTGTLIARVASPEKKIALTFDDGPSARTPEILRLLKQHEVQATFFLVGREMERHPDWTHAIVAAGHEIGNHSWSHPRFLFKSQTEIAHEIEATDAVIRAAGQPTPILFRPPYGQKLFGLPAYLARHGRINLMWNLEPEYWPHERHDPQALTRRLLAEVQPGSIVLLHPMGNYSAAFEALPQLLTALKQAGWHMVTAAELLRGPGISAPSSRSSRSGS